MERTMGLRSKLNYGLVLQFKFKKMVLKIFKAVWFFSLLFLLAVLFYVYAGLGDTVFLAEGESNLAISKDGLFYGALVLIGIINVLVFIINKHLLAGKVGLSSWFYGLIITLNFFLLTTLGFLSVTNASDLFDYVMMGPTIYGSVILVGGWILSLPFFLISKK